MKYTYLILAIIGEICGTTLLKYSEGFSKAIPSIASVLAYLVCFFFLAKTLEHIKLSVTYATWCALGIVGTTAISVFFFKESLGLLGFLGVILIVIGVILLNLYGVSH